MAALEATAGAVRVWTDSRYVCNGARHLEAGTRPPFAHRDLWERARAVWRPGVSAVCWIKAHLDWEAAEERGYPRHAWEGNKRADMLAGRGAASHAVAAEDATRVVAAGEEVDRMQRWMVEALQLVAEGCPPRPKARRGRRRPGTRAPRPLGGPGEHGPISRDGDFWVRGSCDRRVGVTRPWRTWRSMPCVAPVAPPPNPWGRLVTRRSAGAGRPGPSMCCGRRATALFALRAGATAPRGGGPSLGSTCSMARPPPEAVVLSAADPVGPGLGEPPAG